MTTITNQYMQEIWFTLKADGLLSIVTLVTVQSDLGGPYIFNVDADATREIIKGQSSVLAGIFSNDVYPCRSFREMRSPALL